MPYLPPTRKAILRKRLGAYYASAPTTRGAACRGPGPGFAVLFPAGPSRPEAGAAARGAGAPAGGGLRWARAPGKKRRPLTAARGPAASGRPSDGGDTTIRPRRAGWPHPGHLRPGRTGPHGAATERASAPARWYVPSPPTAQPAVPRFLQSEPGDPSSAGYPRQVPTPPASAASPSSPFPLPPPPSPHQNEKYLSGRGRGRGRAGARLSEGQPTVTNSRRNFGGAGFPAANPEACR